MQIFECLIIYVLNDTILEFFILENDWFFICGDSCFTARELYVIQLGVSTPLQHFVNKARSLIDFMLFAIIECSSLELTDIRSVALPHVSYRKASCTLQRGMSEANIAIASWVSNMFSDKWPRKMNKASQRGSQCVMSPKVPIGNKTDTQKKSKMSGLFILSTKQVWNVPVYLGTLMCVGRWETSESCRRTWRLWEASVMNVHMQGVTRAKHA